MDTVLTTRVNDRWCHGAPGFLIFLSTLLKRFGSLSPQPALIVPTPLEAAARVSLSRGARLVYERGLLRKGVGLCHGAGGNVYALLAASDILDSDASFTSGSPSTSPPNASALVELANIDAAASPKPDSEEPEEPDTQLTDRTWLMRATHLAQLAASYEKLTTNGEMSIPDRPYSLYEGAAGMCCAWGEVLRRIDGREGAGRGMPAFDDLTRSL